jgi:hypothetical protein
MFSRAPYDVFAYLLVYTYPRSKTSAVEHKNHNVSRYVIFSVVSMAAS